jgi:CHASE3 domain sensor protein
LKQEHAMSLGTYILLAVAGALSLWAIIEAANAKNDNRLTAEQAQQLARLKLQLSDADAMTADAMEPGDQAF